MSDYQETIPSVTCFFCEDVREEVGGKTSMIGVYRPKLNVKSFPHVIPKFWVVVRAIFLKEEAPSNFVVTARTDWEEAPMFEVKMPEDHATNLAKNTDQASILIEMKMMICPVNIPKAGEMAVFARTERANYRAGLLRVVDISERATTPEKLGT